LLAEESPQLADGAELSAHQVDALSGTLAALIADVQARVNGRPRGSGAGAAEETEPGADEEALDPEEEPKDWEEEAEDEDVVEEAPEDPGASRRFWFEHATGAGKTVAAVGFVEASRTGGVLILTHRRNLVDQFIGEISQRGYGERLSPALLDGADHPYGPVTVETYQWFVRNAGRVSDAYSIVVCDEAHTALGEKTSACIRAWQGPVFIGMTATGALIARHVADLFPTQTSRFDLAQAARRGVIAPLRCIRIPPGPGVRTIAKVPLRKGEVDQDFDQEELAKLLDQTPFNVAIADLYKSRFRRIAGVVYTAGVKHATNVAKAFHDAGINARAVSGETPKRELAEILAAFERGEVDVLCNAMLLAEGWNSPRATICMHLAPTASRRVYQQRVGRVTRRNPGKEAGLVIDLVHPATTHDETIVTLHSLLDRDVYRGGAIVVGPVRRGRGRRIRVEKRVVPVSDDPQRRLRVLERELWRIAVENLSHSEQHVWAALAGARVNPSGWRRAKAMLQHDTTRELRRRFLLTCVQRNRNQPLRLKALAEIASLRDPDAFDDAIDTVGTWSREDKRAGTRVMLEALAERKIGRRDQAQAWVWRLASYTRELHEEYAVQRWPETKRLLGLLVNSSGRAHGRNARRLVHAARNQDRRLATALLAAAVAHTPEGEEVLRGARMRAARKPSAVARELLRNFPKSGSRRRRRKRREPATDGARAEGGNGAEVGGDGQVDEPEARVEAGNGAGAERDAAATDGASNGAEVEKGQQPREAAQAEEEE
jgi:superfamily II DNA or RNA helicase